MYHMLLCLYLSHLCIFKTFNIYLYFIFCINCSTEISITHIFNSKLSITNKKKKQIKQIQNENKTNFGSYYLKKKLDGFKNSNLVDSGEIVGHNIEEQIT